MTDSSLTKDRTWITWETQRRNEELASAFNANYYPLDYSEKSSALRYILSAWHTVRIVFSEKPRTIFCQSPSVVLVILLAFLKKMLPFNLFADLHNAGVDGLEGLPNPIRALYRLAIKNCSGVILSNEELFSNVQSYQATLFALPDRLPRLKSSENLITLKRPAVVFISSFAKDEPIESFLRAVQGLNLHTYVTGKRLKAGELLKFESEKIRFTDFLPEESYDALIKDADLLVDLTTRENCLVCGAYEALSAGVPAILSDSEANRKTFPQGFIHSKNSEQDLAQALQSFLASPEKFKNEIRAAAYNFNIAWQRSFLTIEQNIKELAALD